MKIYKHWFKAEETFTSAEDEVYVLHAWGYSNESQIDAQKVAQDKLKNLKAYHSEDDSFDEKRMYMGYFDRPKPEEILSDQVLGDSSSVLVRNRYGAEILCSEKLCFVDLDYSGFWAALGLKKLAARAICQRVRQVMGKTPSVAYRLYQTKNGFRLVLLDRPHQPKSDATQRLMTSLGADRLYIRMCRAQECFRARLTPKPWRCGVQQLPPEFPATKPGADSARKTWVSNYNTKSANFSTCKLVESVHQDQADRNLLKLCIEVHDVKSGVRNNESPLA